MPATISLGEGLSLRISTSFRLARTHQSAQESNENSFPLSGHQREDNNRDLGYACIQLLNHTDTREGRHYVRAIA